MRLARALASALLTACSAISRWRSSACFSRSAFSRERSFSSTASAYCGGSPMFSICGELMVTGKLSSSAVMLVMIAATASWRLRMSRSAGNFDSAALAAERSLGSRMRASN